jgi:hypothetical protein
VSAMACFTSPSRNESSAGTPSGLCRERSLRAYDGVVNVVGNPSPTTSSVPEPLLPRWSKRVSPQQPQVDDSIGREIRVRGGHSGIPCGTRRIATAATKSGRVSLQLRVLGFGLLEEGDVGVGVFPEGEEVFVSGE